MVILISGVLTILFGYMITNHVIREILSRISRVIEMGQKVVIWPSTIKEKDINDMILSGLNVQSVIKSNTYSGLQAKLKFTTWKKI
jgi:hypothetical protein